MSSNMLRKNLMTSKEKLLKTYPGIFVNQWVYIPEDIFSILIENMPDLWMSVIKGMAKLPIDLAYTIIVLIREVYNALVDF